MARARISITLIAIAFSLVVVMVTVPTARAADPGAPTEGGAVGEDPEATEKDAKKKGKDDPVSGLTGWLGGSNVQFFRMPVFNLPVIREGQIASQVSVSVTLETLDSRNKRKILENHIKIRSAFMRDLYSQVSLSNGSDRTFLIATAKIRLQRVADRVLGPGVVNAILIENVSIRHF